MSYDIFHSYGLDKIHDSFTDNEDYKETSNWNLVSTKTVKDSDGFNTDYSWYTDGTTHIFMFGDTDLYPPDIDYADHETTSESEAKEWFDSYTGFEEESDIWESLDESEYEEMLSEGNANFLNDGFNRTYGVTAELED